MAPGVNRLGALLLTWGFWPCAEADAPISGSPFVFARPLNFESVKPRPGLKITEMIPPVTEFASGGCHDGNHATKDKCLTAPGPGCMWTRVETEDPSLAVQASNSYCLPCTVDGQDIPCWSMGATFGSMVVKDCVMSCSHQLRMAQPYQACSEGPGGVSETECFARGGETSKCMYLAYEDDSGSVQSQCGPCTLPGTGTWGCPNVGAKGVGNTTVRHCASQCEKPCAGPPDCAPTLAPPPVASPNPGIARVASPATEMLSAPSGVNEPPPNPMAVVQAAILAAAAAGHPFTTPPAPKIYFPVVIYRTPADYLATTIPPMMPYQPVWPQAWPQGQPVHWPDYTSADGAALVQQAKPLLAKKRLRSP